MTSTKSIQTIEKKEDNSLIWVLTSIIILLLCGYTYQVIADMNLISEAYHEAFLNGTSYGINQTLINITNCVAFNPMTRQPIIFYDNYTRQNYAYLNVECFNGVANG